jgi:hypothetical protein
MNVDVFVQAISEATTALAPPFVLPANPSVDQFKEALLNHVKAPTAAPPVFGAVLPCRIEECSAAVANLRSLQYNAWFAAIAAHNPAGVPLAIVCVPVPRTSTVVNAMTSDPSAPLELWR